MKKFKIRASAVSQIMTAPRSKSETLSETCKTYCEQWLKEQIYSRTKEFASKYTNKGLDVEKQSIKMIGEHFGINIQKNEQSFENEYMTGTPDVLHTFGIEAKNSWDCFTFPLFETNPDKKHWQQVQVYMELTGIEHFKLVYFLSNTPEEIITSEAWKEVRKQGLDELDYELFEEVAKRHSYDEIPMKHRIKVFHIDKDIEFITAVKLKVVECREFINQLNTNFI